MGASETVQFSKSSTDPVGWVEIANGQDNIQFRPVSGASRIYVGDDTPPDLDVGISLNEGTMARIENANCKVWLLINPNKTIQVIRGDAKLI